MSASWKRRAIPSSASFFTKGEGRTQVLLSTSPKEAGAILNPTTLVFALFSEFFAVFSDFRQSEAKETAQSEERETVREGEREAEKGREGEGEGERPRLQPEDPDEAEPNPLNPLTQPAVDQSPWRQDRGGGGGTKEGSTLTRLAHPFPPPAAHAHFT